MIGGPMKVAAVQHDTVWEDPEANFDHLGPMIAGAAATGARLVVLTEMFSYGFSMATDRTAEPVDGPSTRFLADRAAAHDVWVCGSIPVRPEGATLPFNRLVLAGPAGELHHYDKIHPFTYSGEHEHFAAGDHHVVVDVDGLRVALFVCYDLRFADEFWAVTHRTDLYVVVANWPARRRTHWASLLPARAIENLAYVVGVNRVGDGDGIDYVGDSRIIDPRGEILAAGSTTEVTLVAEVDPALVASTRDRFRFLQDRRS